MGGALGHWSLNKTKIILVEKSVQKDGWYIGVIRALIIFYNFIYSMF